MNNSQNQKTMPHDLAAERAVLTSVMLDNSLLATAIECVSEDDFYAPSHRTIWGAIRGMSSSGAAIDSLTLCNALTESGHLKSCGGEEFISALANGSVDAGNIRDYATIVRDCAYRRSLAREMSKVADMALNREGSVAELTEQAQAAMLLTLKRDETTGSTRTTREVISTIISQLQDPDAGHALPTGIAVLDKALSGGLRGGELTIIAARPSEGKSALAMQIAVYAGLAHAKSVAIASLEMSQEDLFTRSMCSLGDVDHERVRQKNLDEQSWARLADAAEQLSGTSIVVNDRIQSTESLMTWAHGLAMTKKPDLIIVDYLQLLSSQVRADSKRLEIEAATRALKQLAKRLCIPVILLSQLNRALEYRDGRLPMLHDLRESGGIEQDADIVLMLHHPDEESRMTNGHCQIWVRKNRNGVKDAAVDVIFKRNRLRFDYMPRQASSTAQKKVEEPYPGFLDKVRAKNGNSRNVKHDRWESVAIPTRPLTPEEQIALDADLASERESIQSESGFATPVI